MFVAKECLQVHHWNINLLIPADVELAYIITLTDKLIEPLGIKVNSVHKYQAGQFIQYT